MLGRLLPGLLLLSLATPLLAQEREGERPFLAGEVRDFVLDGDLSEWTAPPIRLTGDSRVFSESGSLSREWSGPDDLSGEFRVGYTATDLIIAGTVRDDVLTLNPQVWWLGDEVEVFIDSDLEFDPDSTRYNEDDYQLLLFPLATGRTWGLTMVSGRREAGDGGFDGVRTAAKRLVDDEGNFTGYSFEAALPLVNFPRLKVGKDRQIGFDLALVDADGTTAQKTYMTASGRGNLAVDPSQFGRLEFAGDPPVLPSPAAPASGGLLVPMVILAATIILIVVLWTFRRALLPLSELHAKKKALIAAAALAVVVLSGLAPDMIGALRRSSEESALLEEVAELRETLDEAEASELLGSPLGPDPNLIMSLLRGEPVVPPERFQYEPLWLRPPNLSRTESDTPVIDYRRALSVDERVRFAPQEPVSATAVALVVHLESDLVARQPLEAGAVVATVRVVGADGREKELPVRYGFEVVDHEAAELLAREAKIAWRGADGTHAEEIRVALEEPAAVARVEVLRTVEDGAFVVHGATLVTEDGAVPLPLVSVAETGVLTNLWQDRPWGAGIRLEPGSEPVVAELDPPVDRVWLFFAKAATTAGSTAAGDMVRVTPLLEGGGTGEPVVLRDGVHLVPENEVDRPPGFKADLAWQWTPPGAWPRHRDVLGFDPGEGAVELEFARIGGVDAVLLAGLTQGRRFPHVVVPGQSRLAWSEEGGTYTLTGTSFAGTSFTWFTDGRAEETSFSADEDRAAVLGSTLPTGALADGGPQVRSLGGRRYVAAFLPVGEGDRHVLEASRLIPGAGWIEAAARVVFYVSLTVLLLISLLALVDLSSRLPRLRAKLTLGYAMAALVPLVLLFLGLSGILEREVSRTETSTLLAQIGQVRTKLAEMREEVRRKARDVLDDQGLLQALPPAEGEDYRSDPERRLKEIAATASPFGGPARVFLEDVFPAGGDPGPRVYPRAASDQPFGRNGEPADDIAYRWSSLFLGGVATIAVGSGRRTAAVEVPIGGDLLEELKTRFGRRLELLLFTPRGYPYAGTLVQSGEFSPERMARRRDILAEIDLNRQPVIRQENLAGAPYSVAYDVLRTRRNEPVALVAAGIPRQEFIAARADIRNLFLALGAVILIVEVIVGSILTGRLTAPLTSLARGVRAVASGKLSTRVKARDPDEIGDLSNSFNRMTEELERRIGELSKLNAAVRTLSGSLDREHVLLRATRAFREAATPPDGILFLFPKGEEVEVAAGYRGQQTLGARTLPLGKGLLARALEENAPQALTALDGPLGEATAEERSLLADPASAVVVPFGRGRESRGAVLLLFDTANPELAPSDLEFLSTMAQQVAIAMENARLYQLAIEDVQTGLYVHSYFLARLREETDRALSGGRPISVVLIHLEEVERIYDAYGSEEGDGLVKEISRRLGGVTRGMTILARADRPTVELLLPETGKEAALDFAHQAREALRKGGLKLTGDPSRTVRLTPAIGLATCPDDARSADFLLSEAHRALYKAVTDRVGGRLVDVSGQEVRVERRAEGKAGRYVFRGEEMIELLETVDRIATSDVPVLIQGETGAGKEVIAELIHEKSRRAGKPLVRVNCAALPEALLESELFGYEKGAFTGADRRKPGRFELADGGTIFLDEVGEMPPQTQVKLLRVLQDHRVERLGATSSLEVDVRVIAATNRDLLEQIRKELFREDLYFRLNVVSLVVPPLRARKEEIPDLVDRFIGDYLESHRPTGRRLGPAAMDRLFSHSWPGNVRELRNTIERALVIARDEEVQADEISFSEPTEPVAEEAAPARPARPSRRHKVRTAGINDRQRKLLEILGRRDSISNREFSDLVGVSSRTGNRDLKDLVDRGLIEQIGRRRGALYRLA